MYGGSLGADLKVFGKSKIRLQGNANIGRVDVTMARDLSGGLSQKGWIYSLSAMAGFIF